MDIIFFKIKKHFINKMSIDENLLAILGAVISVPYDLSLFYPLIQYQRQKIRAEQIPIRMYISFLITSTIVSARNVILVDTPAQGNSDLIMFIIVASVSLAIIFISIIWLFWIKFQNRNCKTQILMLILLLIGSLFILSDIILIIQKVKKDISQIPDNETARIILKCITTVVILINTIVPFPFDNFTKCDYKKVPLVTVITGIFDNIGWIVITHYKQERELNIFGYVANGGSLFLNIVHVLFYIYWKYKNDNTIDYTIVTEID